MSSLITTNNLLCSGILPLEIGQPYYITLLVRTPTD